MKRMVEGEWYVTLQEWADSVGITIGRAKNMASKGRLKPLIKLLPVEQPRYFIKAGTKFEDIPYKDQRKRPKSVRGAP